MAGDRRINFGADATDARYRIEDSGDGANFILAEDLDGATVLLEWDDSATPSEWVVRGPVNMGTNDLSAGAIDATSVTTNDLDIGNTDLLSTGDFVSFRDLQSYSRSTTTTSTSYVSDESFFDAQLYWDALPAATDAIQTFGDIDANSGSQDTRLRNIVDNETIWEITGVGTQSVQRVDDYTPTTTSGRTIYRFEIRHSDGNDDARLFRPTVSPGVQL